MPVLGVNSKAALLVAGIHVGDLGTRFSDVLSYVDRKQLRAQLLLAMTGVHRTQGGIVVAVPSSHSSDLGSSEFEWVVCESGDEYTGGSPLPLAQF